jgi:hypothetical protein
MFRTEFCTEPITAALIQINGNRSDMRKMQHQDGALEGATSLVGREDEGKYV